MTTPRSFRLMAGSGAFRAARGRLRLLIPPVTYSLYAHLRTMRHTLNATSG